MKKILSSILSLTMIFALSTTAFAKENTSPPLQIGESQTGEVAAMLDTMPTTQTVVATERDMIENMLANDAISNEDLNRELADLSEQTVDTLQETGYNEKQIEIIKNYEENEDAFEYLFIPNSLTRTARSGAEVTFRYGLAGSGSRRTVTIAYDITWSECPFFTFTDSFGIGWIAADSGSYEIVTKTDSAMGQVDYYDPGTEEYAYLYRDVVIDSSDNGVVLGTPIMGSANGNYGKRIGGTAKVSTQSSSSNMDTIHLFVTYAHTTLAFSFDWEAVLEWDKVSGAISFIPHPRQDVMAEGDHTFRYNSQSVITADKY